MTVRTLVDDTPSAYVRAQEPVVPLCFLRAKPIGVMQMIDQGEQVCARLATSLFGYRTAKEATGLLTGVVRQVVLCSQQVGTPVAW